MPGPLRLSTGRAAAAAAALAVAVHLPALSNRFALDDSAIVERNPAAHSVSAAIAAFDEAYWPPEHGAGQWRPLVILSFAADWSATAGSTVWLHGVNILWHAAATALVVPVLAPLTGAGGAIAGGLIFAVHPVHVEAVANLVGRAELMAVVFLLLALLISRRIRTRAGQRRGTAALEAGLLFAVVAALLSKEHAAVAIALLILDEAAGGAPGRLPRRDYVLVGLLTVAWFLVRRTVEGGLSFQAVAPTFIGLDSVGRLSTMMPVVLEVVRLLAWPFDLSPDYHPRVVERLGAPTPLGFLGAAVLVACGALAFALWRRNRAAAVGLWFIGIAWLPTSNFLFPTGIVLAERTLYLASVGAAFLAASAVLRPALRGRAGLAVLTTVLILFAARTVTRVPAWRSNRDLVVRALLEHPESYKVHQTAARVQMRLGDVSGALREYGIGYELFSGDPYFLSEMAGALLVGGSAGRALSVLRESEGIDSTAPLTHQFLAEALLRLDSARSALRHARLAVRAAPASHMAARMLAASFMALGESDSAVAVWPAFEARGGSPLRRWVMEATTWAALGEVDSAVAMLGRAGSLAPADSVDVRMLRDAWVLVENVTASAPSRLPLGTRNSPEAQPGRGPFRGPEPDR